MDEMQARLEGLRLALGHISEIRSPLEIAMVKDAATAFARFLMTGDFEELKDSDSEPKVWR